MSCFHKGEWINMIGDFNILFDIQGGNWPIIMAHLAQALSLSLRLLHRDFCILLFSTFSSVFCNCLHRWAPRRTMESMNNLRYRCNHCNHDPLQIWIMVKQAKNPDADVPCICGKGIYVQVSCPALYSQAAATRHVDITGAGSMSTNTTTQSGGTNTTPTLEPIDMARRRPRNSRRIMPGTSSRTTLPNPTSQI